MQPALLAEYQPISITPLVRRKFYVDPSLIEYQENWRKYKVAAEGQLASSVNSACFLPLPENENFAEGETENGTPLFPPDAAGREKLNAKTLSFAIVGGTKAEIQTLTVNRREITVKSRAFRHFKEIARCLSFRNDGKLFVVSDDSGLVQVVDVKKLTVLRKWLKHHGPVHCCDFTNDKTRVISGGDDGVIRVWSLPEDACVLEIPTAHNDFVRCLRVCPRTFKLSAPGREIFASGGYEGKVKVWRLNFKGAEEEASKPTSVSEVDRQVQNEERKEERSVAKSMESSDDNKKVPESSTAYQCLYELNHGHPIEAILFFDRSSLLATAGGADVKIWDLGMGGKLSQTFSYHMKTVRAIALTSDNACLVTGSMDQTVKFISVTTGEVLHSFYFEQPVSALTLTPGAALLDLGDESDLLEGSVKLDGFVVGLSDGSWVYKQKPVEPPSDGVNELTLQQRSAAGRGKRRAWQMRGKNEAPAGDDEVVESQRRPKLRKLDMRLRKFQYAKALDSALDDGLAAVVAVIERLLEMDALRIAVRNRSEGDVARLLKFIAHSLGQEIGMTSLLLELLYTVFEENEWLRETDSVSTLAALKKVAQKVHLELTQLGVLRQLSGMIDFIRSSRGSCG